MTAPAQRPPPLRRCGAARHRRRPDRSVHDAPVARRPRREGAGGGRPGDGGVPAAAVSAAATLRAPAPLPPPPPLAVPAGRRVQPVPQAFWLGRSGAGRGRGEAPPLNPPPHRRRAASGWRHAAAAARCPPLRQFAGWGHLTAAAPCVCVCGFRVRGGACRTRLLKKDKNAGECRDGHRSPAWPCHVGERRGWVFSVGRHGLAPSPLHVHRRAYIHGYKCSSPPPPSLRACWRCALPPARAKRPALLHGAGGASARTHTSLHTRHRPRGTRRPTGGRGGIRSLEIFVSRSSEFLDPP